MNKRLFWAILIAHTLLISSVFSQDLGAEIEYIWPHNKVIYAPSQHLNALKPGFRFGFEYILDNQHSITGWSGIYSSSLYFYRNTQLDPENYKNMIGYHIALEPKRYIKSKKDISGYRRYISLTIGFDKTIENRTDIVSRQGGAYLQTLDFERKERSVPLIFHYGRKLFEIGKVQVDSSIGIGRRFFSLANDLPDDSELLNFSFFRNSGDEHQGNFSRFAFQIGLYVTLPV